MFPSISGDYCKFSCVSLFTLDFHVSCSASVFDFFVELVKNSVSFLFLLISLHFFSSCMSCLVSYYHLLAEKALACKILYAQGDVIRFRNLSGNRGKITIFLEFFKNESNTFLESLLHLL